MSGAAIHVVDLGKQYLVGRRKHRMDLRESLAQRFSGGFFSPAFPKAIPATKTIDLPLSRTDWALRHVHFEVERNDIVGVLGDNGGGKTTLLKILARISQPTEGYAEVRGRVGALLDGGAGFHAELTGRENVFLLASLLGTKRIEDRRQLDAVVAFAELEDSIDTPLKYYSSGMCVRLAFAVAAHLDVEVLLVDEVLAVADATFQKKSLEQMISRNARSRAVLFVSHDLEYVRRLCRHAIVLSGGRVAFFGSATEGVDYYKSISTLCRDEWGDPRSPEPSQSPVQTATRIQDTGSGQRSGTLDFERARWPQHFRAR
jgi:lipopolysaccharide transport system ATP-binding protein